jgi:hypothetical protein
MRKSHSQKVSLCPKNMALNCEIRCKTWKPLDQIGNDKINGSYYLWFQNLLSSYLPSENVKIRIYKTMILHAVLYGCETCCLTLREEHKPKVFENRARTGC